MRIALILFLAHFAQFWPFYIQKLLPFPGDMLVAFYFPWSGGGFAGYDRWTTYKALNTVDVVKQFYPWKVFAMDLLHRGIWPLWNPYSFSGMPFIANLQSGIFFPLNLIYALVPVLWGWVTNVLVQLFLFGVFSYLFLRSEKLSKTAAVFGAVVLMNLSYITLWHWQLVITQSALFLPLILYFVNVYSVKKHFKFLLIISLLLAFCFFGGHAQTVIYVYLIFWLFALYRKVPLKLLILTSIFPIILAAVQLFPSFETYMHSAREGSATKELFAPFVFHWKNITTVLAPDFFGHPSSRNYTGTDYRDMNAYFGLTAAIFSLISLFWLKTQKSVRLFLFLSAIGLAFAAPPFVFIFDKFNIPVLSSGVPARMIFVFQFAAAVLSAWGFEYWLNNKAKFHRPITISLSFISFCLAVLWIFAILNHNLSGQVSRNNLILPTFLFVASAFFLVTKNIFPKLKWAAVAGIFILLFIQYSYFFTKYNSFSPQKFVFPKHPVLTYLQKKAGINRFFGTDNAQMNYNFSVYYQLYDFEGYDSMYPRRYGELIASVDSASIPKVIPRSDAYFTHWSDRLSARLLDLLGVKFLLDKNELLTGEWEPEESKFSPQHYTLVWQHLPWRIFERKNVLPRFGLFGKYSVEKDNQKIIAQLYDPNFDYQNTLVLEESPTITPQPTTAKNINLISYEPNKIVFKIQSDQPQLLFLSDNYYPGWQVFVDDKPEKILRANYTFRAVNLPAGEHKVVFTYDPPAFKIGLIVSVLSLFLFCGLMIRSRKT